MSAARSGAASPAATSRRCCCGDRPGPARPASPACSRPRSAPISRRCRRSCRASPRSAATIAEAQERLEPPRHAERPLPRRDPSLQQGPAGRAPPPRRGRHRHAHRRDDREPVLRGQLGAPVADARLAPRGADRRGGRGRRPPGARPTRSAGWPARSGRTAASPSPTTPSSTSSRSPAATPGRRSTSSRARRPSPNPRTIRDAEGPRQSATRGCRDRRPAARARLRPGRRRPLRHGLGVHQEPARQRPGRRALLAGGDDRGRRGPQVHRPAADHQRVARTSGTPTRARCPWRSPRARRSTGSGCPRRSTRSPRRPSTSPRRRSRTASGAAYYGGAGRRRWRRASLPVPNHLRNGRRPADEAARHRRRLRVPARLRGRRRRAAVPARRARRAPLLPAQRPGPRGDDRGPHGGPRRGATGRSRARRAGRPHRWPG